MQIVKVTGPFFLHFIIRELKFHLTKDFELHTLNYTVSQIVSGLIEGASLEELNGTLD